MYKEVLTSAYRLKSKFLYVQEDFFQGKFA